MTDAFTALIAHFKQIAALEQVGGVLGWDQETHMPEKGAQQRAEQFAALTSVMHEKLTDRRVTDWLAEAAEESVMANSVCGANSVAAWSAGHTQFACPWAENR